MKKVGIITVILLLIASAAVIAQQRGGGSRGDGICDFGGPGMGPQGPGRGQGHGHGPRGGMLLGLANELELTDAQIQSIKDLNFKHQEAMIDVRASLKKARLNERKEMTSDNPDKDKVLFYTREINKIEGQIAEMRVDHQFAIRAVLTADQQAKLKELRKKGPGFGPENAPGQGRGARGNRGHGMIDNDNDNTSYGMRLRDGNCVSGR